MTDEESQEYETHGHKNRLTMQHRITLSIAKLINTRSENNTCILYLLSTEVIT